MHVETGAPWYSMLTEMHKYVFGFYTIHIPHVLFHFTLELVKGAL